MYLKKSIAADAAREIDEGTVAMELSVNQTEAWRSRK